MIGKLTSNAGMGLHISPAEQLTILELVLLGRPAQIPPNAPVRPNESGDIRNTRGLTPFDRACDGGGCQGKRSKLCEESH